MAQLTPEVRRVIEAIFDSYMKQETLEHGWIWGLEQMNIEANIETVLAYSAGLVYGMVNQVSINIHGEVSNKDLIYAIPIMTRRINDLRERLMRDRLFPE